MTDKTKTIMVLRHGTSPSGLLHHDFDRPLSEKGIAESVYIGNLCADKKYKGLTPDLK